MVEQSLRILMKQERTKDLVHLVPWAVLTMKSQRSSSTGFFVFLRRPVRTKFWAGAPPHAKYIGWGYNIQEGR